MCAQTEDPYGDFEPEQNSSEYMEVKSVQKPSRVSETEVVILVPKHPEQD